MTERAGAQAASGGNDPQQERAVVKGILAALAGRAPGRSVELRVPPHGAIQLIDGPAHRRGTPKATVEMNPRTIIALANGSTDWESAVAAGSVLASGERADLGFLFPLDQT